MDMSQRHYHNMFLALRQPRKHNDKMALFITFTDDNQHIRKHFQDYYYPLNRNFVFDFSFAIIPTDEETEVGLGSEIKPRSSKAFNTTNGKKLNGESDVDDDEQEKDEEEVLDDEVLRALDEMKKATPVVRPILFIN